MGCYPTQVRLSGVSVQTTGRFQHRGMMISAETARPVNDETGYGRRLAHLARELSGQSVKEHGD